MRFRVCFSKQLSGGRHALLCPHPRPRERPSAHKNRQRTYAIVHVGELSCPARAEKNKSLASGYAADQIMARPPIGTDRGLSGGIFATTPRFCLGITTGWRRRFVLSAGPYPPPVRKIPFDGSQDAPDTSDDDRTSLQGAKPQRRIEEAHERAVKVFSSPFKNKRKFAKTAISSRHISAALHVFLEMSHMTGSSTRWQIPHQTVSTKKPSSRSFFRSVGPPPYLPAWLRRMLLREIPPPLPRLHPCWWQP